MSDPVPDIEPPLPEVPKPTISGPNSFFIYLAMILAFLVYWRLSWEAVLLLLGQSLDANSLTALFCVWMIPILGILGSIMVPSLGTTTLWLIGSSAVGALPLLLAIGYVLLFGNRISP